MSRTPEIRKVPGCMSSRRWGANDPYRLKSGQPWWAPTTPGLEFKPVPGATKPADSVAQRARQMRVLAEGFRASDSYGC